MPALRFKTALLLCLLLPALLQCAPRTDTPALPLVVPDTFSDSGAVQMPDRWWLAFEDSVLNGLVHEALQANFDLLSAWHRLREAKAVAKREGAALFPMLEGEAEGEITRSDGGNTERLQLGLTASYEVDLWGRIGSAVAAEEYRAKASLEEYRTAALSLTAELVLSWYRLLEAQSELALLSRQAQTNQQTLDLLKNRFYAGQLRGVDVLRQQQLLESTREQQLAAGSRIEVLRHQLSVLLGRMPQQAPQAELSGLPTLPPLPDTGLPAELVNRRPDVRSAFLELKAADSDLAAAVSNQYPRLNLSASLVTLDDGSSKLFEDWIRSLAGNLLAPLFDGGRRAAEVERTDAVRSRRLYAYGQTVLQSFKEVEDALIREQQQVRRIESIAEQVRLAGESLDRLRTAYFNGAGNFIDVLIAETEVQELERELLASRLLRLEYRIGLYRALAGGFETQREHGDNT